MGPGRRRGQRCSIYLCATTVESRKGQEANRVASQACLIIAPKGGIPETRSNAPAEKCQMPCSIPVSVLGFRTGFIAN